MNKNLKFAITLFIALLVGGAFIYYTEKSKDQYFKNMKSPSNCFPLK